MRICSQYVGLRKVYEMTEFQSFKISKFERVAPNSVSGLVFYIVSFFFVLIFVLGIPDVILAQETSEDDGLEDVLSGFDVKVQMKMKHFPDLMKVAPNSVSGRWIPMVKENPESTMRIGVICPEVQD